MSLSLIRFRGELWLGGRERLSWNVADVMAKDVVTIDARASFKTCVRSMRMHGIGALPVVADGKLAGIITVTDLMLKEFRPSVRERFERSGADEPGPSAATLMSRNVVTVPPDAPLVTAVRLMFEHRINQVPVVAVDGRLAGIISRSDVLRVFLRSDASIRKEVTQNLLSDMPLVARGRVEPEVHDGVVTLEGELEAGPLTDVMLRLVASIPGVVGVHNHLKLFRRRRRPRTA